MLDWRPVRTGRVTGGARRSGSFARILRDAGAIKSLNRPILAFSPSASGAVAKCLFGATPNTFVISVI